MEGGGGWGYGVYMPLLAGSVTNIHILFLFSIGKATGYKTSELATLAEGHTLVIGSKEIEVPS